MTEIQEQPRSGELTIPNVDGIFSTQIPEVIRPKLTYLKPWFNYFDNNLDLDNVRLEEMKREFTAAHVLEQAAGWEDPAKKLAFKNREELHFMGIDPARILRYLILQDAYPKGIELNNPTITLSLETKTDQLLKIIKKIPGYENFDQNGLINLINNLGFSKNQYAEGYFCQLKQDEFKKFLNGIINTSSL